MVTDVCASQPHPGTSVRDWMALRAASDPQMQAAAARRTPTSGANADPDRSRDVLAVLSRQHNQVNALVKQLQVLPTHGSGASPTQLDLRATLIDLIRDLLVRHEAAERKHLWPAVRASLPDGDERADRALQQEEEGDRTLSALVDATPASDAHDELVQQLISQVRAHVAFEDKVFLDLLTVTDEPTRQQWGERLLGAFEGSPMSRSATKPRTNRPKEKA